VAASIDEKEAKLKQLLLYDDKIVLRSLNPLYPEMLFAGDKRKKLQIAGVVVDLMRRIL
jgi:SOS-response transcriptional repressor LexA